MAHEHVLLSKERYERLLKNANFNSKREALVMDHPEMEKVETPQHDMIAGDKKNSEVKNANRRQSLKRPVPAKQVAPSLKRHKKKYVPNTGSKKGRTRDDVLNLRPKEKPDVSPNDELDFSPRIPGILKKDFERQFSNTVFTSKRNNITGLPNGVKKKEITVNEKNKTARKKNEEIVKNWINF